MRQICHYTGGGGGGGGEKETHQYTVGIVVPLNYTKLHVIVPSSARLMFLGWQYCFCCSLQG